MRIRVLKRFAQPQRFVRGRRWLGCDSDRCNLTQRLQHIGVGLQVVPAIGQVEGLIDEREIGHDVADNGVLEDGPVLPGGIVRMTARTVPVGTRLQPHEHRAAPAFDEPDPKGTFGGCGTALQRMGPLGSASRMCRIERQDSCSSSKRTVTRAATSPSLRQFSARAHRAYGGHGRSMRRSKAWPLARPASPVRPKRARKIGGDGARAGESIADPFVLFIDRAQYPWLRLRIRLNDEAQLLCFGYVESARVPPGTMASIR